MRLTKTGTLLALKEIERDGMLWTCRSYEAPQIWASLKRRGLVEINPWSGRYRLSSAGRAALTEGKDE